MLHILTTNVVNSQGQCQGDIGRLESNTEMCHVRQNLVTLSALRGSSKFVNVINDENSKLVGLSMSQNK